MYPPTVPPRSVMIAGTRACTPASGTNVFLMADPTGGFTTTITIKITTIIIAPRTFVSVSMAPFAFLERNTRIASTPASTYPTLVGIPRRVLKPSAPPPTLPILNTRPPKTTIKATRYPSPGSTLFATSCPLSPVTHSTLQIFICATADSRMEIRITNPKLA